MIIDFNGVVREMTTEEIERLENLTTLFTENNETDNDISERINKLEKEAANTVIELTNLREAINAVKKLDKLTTN